MKTIFLSILCLFLVFTGNAQEAVKKPKTEADLTKNCIKVTIVVEAYKSSNGKVFLLKKSKNGVFYKIYITQ